MVTKPSSPRYELGQVLTPPPVGRLMASFLDVTRKPVRVLDPGAGAGSLCAAVAERWAAKKGGKLDLTGIEVDPPMVTQLEKTLAACAEAGATTRVLHTDFVRWAAEQVTHGERFDVAILNPPYRKIRTDSPERCLVTSWGGPDVSNLYAAFVVAALALLSQGGQLVAITPRSWANGPYFGRFRKFLFKYSALTHLHVYETRNTAFAGDGVLQENVIFRLVRGAEQGSVHLSHAWSPADEPRVVTVPFERVVRPGDPALFVHLEVEEDAAEIAERMSSMPSTLSDLGISVSTGRVVDFRARWALRSDPEPGTAPLVYPAHLRHGRVLWPQPGAKKPNALVADQRTAVLLLPNGHYPVVKRFSSKEERRRVVAALSTPHDVPGEVIGFENHTNVYHQANQGLDPLLAAGLVAYLNSSLVDRYFRSFSGHTQVNATDLRRLRYPDAEMLKAMGNDVGDLRLTQDQFDNLLGAALS